MKFLTLIAVFSFLSVFSNEDNIPNILKKEVSFKTEVKPDEQINIIYLRCAFGSDEILNPEVLENIKGAVITNVDLVFTSYKTEVSFDQIELNRKRLRQLKKHAPELLQNDLIEWNVIAQTKCSSTLEGIETFHGFMITYQPLPTKELLDKELDYIDRVLSGDIKTESIEESTGDYSVEEFILIEELPSMKGGEEALIHFLSKNIHYPATALDNNIQGTVMIRFIVEEDGTLSNIEPYIGIGGGCEEEAIRIIKSMPKWNPGLSRGLPLRTTFMLPVHFKIGDEIDTAKPIYYPMSSEFSTAISSETYTSFYQPKPDSTLFKVFKRNPNWNKQLMVCDFTGSMSPYTAQLLV